MKQPETYQSAKKPRPMNRKNKTFVPPTENEIACCAYAIYAGEHPQHASQLWREAEAQLMADRQHDAGLSPLHSLQYSGRKL